MKKSVIITISVAAIILLLVIIVINNSKPKALIAFVIDDWGYNKKNIDLAIAIDRPLAISILPNLRYSKYVAEEITKAGTEHDLILHLPLESKSNRAAEKNTIRGTMEEEKIISIIEKELNSLPAVIGVSNHQGSKATTDESLMKIVLEELKRKNLFFLDSVTTSGSVCEDVAKDIRLKFSKRDVFLDLTDQTDINNFESYVRGQVRELAKVALKQGRAIGVGHNKKITLEVLKDMIPELEEKGIKIVPLRELMK